MNRRITICLSFVFILCCALPAIAQQSVDDCLDLISSSLRREHPRLLFTQPMQRELQKTAKADPLLQRLIEQNRVNAEAMLTRQSIRYEIPDGKRLLAQSRKCIERVTTLAMAYRLSGDSRFADAAIREMLIAARFKDWNPSHFLDTAEMTTALAIGYDWLFDVIEPDDKTEIRASIVRMGLKAGLSVYEKRGWWTTRDNNWNQVCNGGLLMGALAIAEDEPELAAQIMHRALKSIPYALRPYSPDGAYPEGPAYWQYGTTYTCLTIQALSTALGNDLGISNSPGLNLTGNFRMHTIGPTGLYFNYADAGSKSRLGSSMWILSEIFDNETFRRWHVRRLESGLAGRIGEIQPKRIDRFFPLEIAFYRPAEVAESKTTLPLDALFRGQQDVVTLRGSWDDPDAAYIGFKGGDNRANHGHLDIGSFVFDSGGVRWAIDLGSDNYNLPGYFGSKRWSYYRLTNRSHNTLVINDKLQNPKAIGRVVAFGSSEQRSAAIVDMTDAYAGQVDSAKRGIELVDRHALHVRDELTHPTGKVRWAMVTQAQITIDGPNATLEQGGKTLKVQLRSPAGAVFEVLSTAPPTSVEKPNQGTRMLAVRVEPKPGERLVIDVVMQLDNDDPVATKSFSSTLASWPASPVKEPKK